jgi:LacI family transcriptional regulator
MSDNGRPLGRRITMTDVARAAGVSQTTVSFVLNDRADVVVAPETRTRVLESAARLGYRVNRTAVSLRLGRSFTIGVVTDGIVSQPYAGLIVQGIQHRVQPAGYVCIAVDTTDDPAEGDAAVSNLLDQGVAGIIYASPAPKPVHRSGSLDGTRTVFVNCWPSDGHHRDTVILADEYEGGRTAARAAFERGHRDVAFIGGLQGEYAYEQRRSGFVDVAREFGIDPDTLVQVHGDYSIGSGYDLTRSVFAASQPTALVCGNDRMAIGALLAANSLGLRCPDDIGIIGFDDQVDVASQIRPGLTTVALPHFEMGTRAGGLIIDDRAPDDPGIVIPCPLVERDSIRPI